MSHLNKLPCEVLRVVFQYLPRKDRTNLLLLFSKGGYSKTMKEALEIVALRIKDSVAKWESARDFEETEVGMKSFLLSPDQTWTSLGVLPDKTKTLLTDVFQFSDAIKESRDPLPAAIVCRWNGSEKDNIKVDHKKSLVIQSFVQLSPDEDFFDILVIYLQPEEEIFWKLCGSHSIPGEALPVDKTGQGELLFLGYKDDGRPDGGGQPSKFSHRLGYVRADEGLMHHHKNGEVEVRWEVREGFYVLCAREKLFC